MSIPVFLTSRFSPLAAVKYLAIAAASLLIDASVSASEGIWSQLVFPFTSERPWTQEWDSVENTLVLEIQKTSPSELPAIDLYDERLIRRVMIKDMGPAGTQIRLVLRNRDIRATVVDFNEPFRIVVDIYDKTWTGARDVATGLPLTESPAKSDSVTSNSGNSETPHMTHAPLSENPQSGAKSHSETANQNTSGRRLLQVPDRLFADPAEMSDALSKVDGGIGKSWSTWPVYIYRLQSTLTSTANPEQNTESKDALSTPPKVLDSAAAMADYASRLFALGHESRALIAYQQVLHKDARIFDNDPGHLWRFAEVHLGQGNLTLAEGYFDALASRHGEHPLAPFARLRGLDIRAIRLIRTGKNSELPNLMGQLDRVSSRAQGELKAQINLRKAWWSNPKVTGMPGVKDIPALSDELRRELGTAFTEVEGQRTAFLTASLLLADMIRPKAPWTAENGSFSARYFQRFSGKAAEPYRSVLRDGLQDKIASVIQTHVAEGRFMEAIRDFEALPASLQSIKKLPATAWAIGEAYRAVGQGETAIQFYETATQATSSPDRFRAQFWLAVTAGDTAEQMREANGTTAKVNNLKKKSRDADVAMAKTWGTLKPDEQKNLTVALKDPIERTVTAPSMLRTPPQIMLSTWTDAFSTKVTTTSGGNPTDWERNFSPAVSTTTFVTDLGKRFGELGMVNERRQALQLLRKVKPAETDKEAQKIWAAELIKLAEEYRTNNDYLEAGRIYAFIGEEGTNLESRAETLYKGGLLLFRAGRKEEAIAAFQKAKADGNNLFYANLADERLNQIESK
jgi:tetratricopeptide (TPR) repeat protein